ncbi:hypothetical protein IQ07DRAFT_394272 [Pyrenochaeta sp. DS3sAY3a]|nr:hypothetical protein IQ07DRAFT_394272 [Pyrenochaeta sp. DS3sAY3a]
MRPAPARMGWGRWPWAARADAAQEPTRCLPAHRKCRNKSGPWPSLRIARQLQPWLNLSVRCTAVGASLSLPRLPVFHVPFHPRPQHHSPAWHCCSGPCPTLSHSLTQPCLISALPLYQFRPELAAALPSSAPLCSSWLPAQSIHPGRGCTGAV